MSQRVSDVRLARALEHDARGRRIGVERALWGGIYVGNALRDLRDARAEIARLREPEAAAYLRGFEEARRRGAIQADGACRADEACQRDGGCSHVPCITGRMIASEIRALQPGGPND